MKKEDLEQIASLVFEKMRDAGAVKPGARGAEAMVTLTARIPKEFLDLLDRIAGETKQSRSEVLRDLLRDTATKRAKK